MARHLASSRLAKVSAQPARPSAVSSSSTRMSPSRNYAREPMRRCLRRLIQEHDLPVWAGCRTEFGRRAVNLWVHALFLKLLLALFGDGCQPQVADPVVELAPVEAVQVQRRPRPRSAPAPTR